MSYDLEASVKKLKKMVKMFYYSGTFVRISNLLFLKGLLGLFGNLKSK